MKVTKLKDRSSIKQMINVNSEFTPHFSKTDGRVKPTDTFQNVQAPDFTLYHPT